jgi:hypothetical protein
MGRVILCIFSEDVIRKEMYMDIYDFHNCSSFIPPTFARVIPAKASEIILSE